MASVSDENVVKRTKVAHHQEPNEMMSNENVAIQGKTIDSLSNELLAKVLAKLKARKLIRIRAVCKQWQEEIETICREKTSLLIIEKKYCKCRRVCPAEQQFNGLVDFDKNVAVFKVKKIKFQTISLFGKFCDQLVKLFPHVESLLIDPILDYTIATQENLFTLLQKWSPTLVNLHLSAPDDLPVSRRLPLYDLIEKMASLKRLHFLSVDFPKPKTHESTLARLEHTSCFHVMPPEVLPFVGPNFTSLNVFGDLRFDNITQWPKLNAQLVKSLTHFKLWAMDRRVYPFICANFSALKLLDIHFWERETTYNANIVFAGLSQLSSLSQLTFFFFEFDLTSLARFNLSPITSVKIFSMEISDVQLDDHRRFNGGQFCRVLAHIFPNLEQLTIKHDSYFVRMAIIEHLDRFVHLRKHTIVGSASTTPFCSCKYDFNTFVRFSGH